MLFRVCCGGAKEEGSQDRSVDLVPTNDNNHNSSDEQVGSLLRPRGTTILLEIAGVLGLLQEDADSYCVVKVGNKKVHQTKTIKNDPSPIWTAKTKSLCLLTVKEDDTVTVQVCCQDKLVPTDIGDLVPIGTTTLTVGAVSLPYARLLGGDGERQDLELAKSTDNTGGRTTSLAVRYRPATETDRQFLERKDGNFLLSQRSVRGVHHQDHAADVDFKNVTNKALLKNQTKVERIDGKRETMYRVWPFPDPACPKETEFLSKTQIRQVAREPSRYWVEGGSGAFGTVHLEILGCDDLPNMDTELVSGKTDAFIGCVFESNYVRSSVVHDTLHPRWVPWSHRAFMFNIEHPASHIFLGVFDFDEGPLDSHDPIGRVVINFQNFEHDTLYCLKYSLSNGITEEANAQGTLNLRLRVHWHDARKASRAMSFTTPPRFMINVESEKSWKVLRYLTRGSVDMDVVTVQSVKLYANELVGYLIKYCYLLDLLAEVLLWRGRMHFKFFGREVSLWCPIHSMVLLASFVLAIERPEFLPSVAFYLIAYVFLWHNYYQSHHPSPWSRVRPFRRFLSSGRFGSPAKGFRIEPGSSVEDEKLLSKLDEYKTHRVTGFLYEFMTIGLKVYRVYSKNTPVDVSTVANSGGLLSGLYVNYLAYLHMMLRLLCKNIRVLRNFVNFKGPSTYQFTWKLFLYATAWAIFPYKRIVLWVLRLFVWSCLGPWVKLLDVFWIHKYYRTKEDLLKDGTPETVEEMTAEIARRPNILEPLLHSGWLQQMGKSGRVVVEDNLKLRDFREMKFGKYSERVPTVDSSRFPSIPLSSSRAQPYLSSGDTKKREEDHQDNESSSKVWTSAPSQKLVGSMIPVQAH